MSAPGTHDDATTRTVFRVCPLCEATCGIAVTVDTAAGRVVDLRGDAEDPFSRGYICPKAWGLKALQEDPDRLRAPLVRADGELREASWDEALDRVAARLGAVRAEHGADAIAVYLGNPNVHNLGAMLYLPAFLRALGTRWRFSATSVDQLPKMLTACLMFGAPLSIPIPDVDRTDHLLLLGANPLASNGSLMTAPDLPGRLRALRERGGRLVVVDPRRTETARRADVHVPIRPGTDALLLLAMVHVLFAEQRVALGRLAPFTRGVDALRALAKPFSPEAVAPRTGIDAATTRTLARELATARRAVCYGRLGTCTQRFGTLASGLVDALNVLTGNLDRPGGAMFPNPAAPLAQRSPGRIPYARWRSRVRGLPEFAGELPVATLAEEIDTPGEGRVRALVTVAGNPVLSTPNGGRLTAALARLDFLVALDLYLNETTVHADVVLPVTTPLERSHYDLAFNALAVRDVAKFSPPALEPPADARHDGQMLLELAARLTGATPEQIDVAVLGHLVERWAQGRDDRAARAWAELGSDGGPERVLDFLLRSGPYGDQFGERDAGLTLAALRACVHGLDIGPLRPRLPELLATPNATIELAPALLVGDLRRLRAELDGPDTEGDALLVGRRHLRSNNSWMHNLEPLVKGPERCTLLVHPDDARRLGLRDGGRAWLRSRAGEVVAPVRVSDEVAPGVVSLPHGWGHDVPGTRLAVARSRAGVNANRLADETDVDAPSGNAVLNGIPVRVGPA